MTEGCVVRYLEAGDAKALMSCFEACYGNSYANPMFYDAADLVQAIESRYLRGVVALLDNKLVGHTGLTVHCEGAEVAEAGNTVVIPACRGRGVLGELSKLLSQRTLMEGFVGYVHYPTTAHAIMQKSATSGDGRETGIMLSYIPAETEYNNFDGVRGRLAATVVYQPLADCPTKEVYLPGRYAELIRDLAGSLSISRRYLKPGIPVATASELEWKVNPGRGVDRLLVRSVTHKLKQLAETYLMTSTAKVVQVDLLMQDPGIDFSVETFHAMGFVYCAWLPGFAESDVLRLQKINQQQASDFAPSLVTTEAKNLLDLMRQEAGI